jgi:regulation of enolase protein 1 (concanavalin A-like superfamily)
VGTQTFVKGGVMIRAGTANNAQYASILATNTASNGWRFQYRLTTGSAAAQIRQSGSSVTPGWLRLVRSGSTITASTSSNGSTWTTVGSQNITLPTTFQIGFAVTSHQQGAATTAVFDSVTITP